jgi:hypothetical protein
MRDGKKCWRACIFARMGGRRRLRAWRALSALWLMGVVTLLMHLSSSTAAAGTFGATCPGDCNVDWRVDVHELVQGLGILLGKDLLDLCRPLDSNDDQELRIDELVAAVDRSLNGCRETPTPTDTPTETPTPTPTATLTPTPPIGPRIVFFGVTLADDSLLDSREMSPDQIPIFTLPVHSGFSLVVEAERGLSGLPVGDRTFDLFGVPDLQIQATSQLGDGSEMVCDDDMENPGGVPAVDPPRFDDSARVIGALNDLGCRFLDGLGLPNARNCTEQACIRFETGQFGCRSEDAERQFCGVITAALSFPLGETLVSARVLDADGNVGPVERLIVRIARPTPVPGG